MVSSSASMRLKGLMVTALTISFAYGTAGAFAAQIEDPPTASAAAILGKQVQGSNYQIEEAVRGDGDRGVGHSLRIYSAPASPFVR